MQLSPTFWSWGTKHRHCAYAEPTCTHSSYYLHRKKTKGILKAAKVTTGSASSKVVFYSRHPVTEWKAYCWSGQSMVFCYLILKGKPASLFNKWNYIIHKVLYTGCVFIVSFQLFLYLVLLWVLLAIWYDLVGYFLHLGIFNNVSI